MCVCVCACVCVCVCLCACVCDEKGQNLKKGAGRPLSYSPALEEEIVHWVLESRDFHVPISRKMGSPCTEDPVNATTSNRKCDVIIT